MANASTAGNTPDASDISKSTFAPQPTNSKFLHAWDRAPVQSKAPRLGGKKVWKKLMRAFGSNTEDEKLQQAQAELETAGAGGRKKMRMTSTKTNIRDAEWEGTEWHGFADDVMRDVQSAVDENEGTKGSKRRNNDKIVTPRKPLRQTVNLNQQVKAAEEVLDDEVTIAKRARKAMRKSGGSRMSLLASDNTLTSTPKSSKSPKMANDATLRQTSSTTIISPTKTSPSKKVLMRSKTTQRRTSSSSPRRLSGALFADASPITTSTPPNVNIDFNAPTANAIKFGAKSAVGTPVRPAFGTPVPGTPVRGTPRGAPVSAFAMHKAPRTAPAKIQPTRSEIEQEMASFFTPIPRLKKIKRRSSPIKSYLQQLLENREDSAVTANQEAQDAAEAKVVIPEEAEAESPLAFARDRPPASREAPIAEQSEQPVEEPVDEEMQGSSPPVQISSPRSPHVEEHEDESKLEVHASLDAVASVVAPAAAAVRLDFESVPDLSIERLGSFADDSVLSQDDSAIMEGSQALDDNDEDEDEDEEEDDFDPADQLIAEFAASQEEEASNSDSEVDANEQAIVDDEDDLMLDAPAVTLSETADAPAFESSISISTDIAVESSSDSHDSNDEAISDTSASDEAAADNTTNVSTSFDDEETAMLLAFVTKNQAKKLARTSPKSKHLHTPHSPLRLPLSEVAGNEEEVTKAVLKVKGRDDAPASPTKKSRRLNPSTVTDILSDLPASEVPEPSSAVRRSTRGVAKQSKIPAPPSFIPVRGLSGVDAHEAKAPKKEKTVEQITKLNTGKNKAGCLQPMVMLKRLKMEEKMGGKATSPKKVATEGKNGKEKKKLVWAKELTAVREFDEKSIVRPAEKASAAEKKKEKAAGAKLEETKKTRVRVGTASERASKAALGMVANGTPAKRKSKEIVDVKEDKKVKPAAKKVRQPKLRSPKVKVAKKDEDAVMG